MQILMIYGTIEGQTAKIAKFIAEDLQSAGHKVDLLDTDGIGQIDVKQADAVILAASVHERRHPKNFEASLIAHQAELAACPTLLLSVSLNAAFDEGRPEAAEYVEEMKMRTGLEPDAELLVAGAVRASQYDYFAMQVVQHVVMRGRDFDRSTQEHEFTDWEALATFVEAFLAS